MQLVIGCNYHTKWQRNKEFFEMYPVELLPVRSKGENPDRTKEYFYNKKSY